jgi:hypothetical protein
MKKILLAVAIAVSAQFSVFAQTYNFTKTTGTYADLTGATTVSAAGWDEEQYLVPLGFTFSIGNLTYTDVIVDDNGAILVADIANQAVKGGIIAFDVDMMDRGITTNPSTINKVTTGTAGSRITKIEWKNAGFYDDASSTSTTFVPFPNDFINFQVWIYEGSNKIEVHFGSSNITPANTTAIFGTTGGASTAIITAITGSGASSTLTGVALQGPAATPTMVPFSSSTTIPAVTGVPTSGTIYAFNTSISGIRKDLNDASIAVYPNPVTESLKFTGLTAGKTATVKIYDALGKVVKAEVISADGVMNVSNLKNGTYFVEINSAAGRTGKQIIKQ